MDIPLITRPSLINTILRATRGKTYLEIGVRYGGTFFRVHCKNKIGIDPKSRLACFITPLINTLKSEKSEIFFTTSDDFFHTHSTRLKKHKIDVAFVDGLHSFEQSLTDTENCLKYLNNRGVILLHDCNPMTYQLSKKPDNIFTLTEIWSGDVWKTIVYLRSKRRDLAIVTLDCDYGIGLIKKGKPDNPLKYSLANVKKMRYKDLVGNRDRFLNLKESDYLSDFLR